MTTSIEAINIVRDSLRTNLQDLYETAGGAHRGGSMYIFGNEPITAFKYPQIQLKKIDNPSEPIDIGYNYMEHEQLFINIWVYVKQGFKVTISGTEYTNAQVIEYLLGNIKTTLKAQASTLHDSGAKMYKHVNTTIVDYDPDTQLHFGAVTVRVAYFNR